MTTSRLFLFVTEVLSVALDCFVSGSITLTVSPSSVVEVNQTVTLQCSFESNPIGAVFYSSRDTTPSFCDLEHLGGVCKQLSECSSNYTTSCPNDTTYIVQYPVPQSWNGATVYCKGLSTGDERSTNITFSVTVLVTSVTLTPAEVTVDVSKQRTLTCQTNYCNPAATITWHKSPPVISSQGTSTMDSNSDGLHRTTSVLTYTGVAVDNGQEVYCRASNRPGQQVESNRGLLNVRYPPSSDPVITASPAGLQYDSGTRVNLTCQLSGGNPIATLSWRCKGVDRTGTNQNNSTTAVSVLSLVMNSSYNNRQCTCTANHRLLTTPKSTSVTLVVNGSITLTVSPSSDVEVNQTVTLQCSFESNPISAIFYYSKNPTSPFCDLESSGGVCKANNTCSRTYTTSCPDDTTYSVQYPVPQSWNGATAYCRGLLTGDERSNRVTFSVTGPPSLPTNVTLVCDNPSQVELSWISNFDGGDSQTFKVSYSAVGDSSYKDLETISDGGYGIIHSYTPSIELQGTVWFTVTASNLIGKSTSDTVHCTIIRIQESVGNQTGVAVGSAIGIVTFIIIILVLVIFLRRRYTCIIKLRKSIDEDVKISDLTKDECNTPMTDQNVHVQGERGLYEELNERENRNQYEDLSTKDQLENQTQTYESIQGYSDENKYEKLSTKQGNDDKDQTYCNSKTTTPVDVYSNTSI